MGEAFHEAFWVHTGTIILIMLGAWLLGLILGWIIWGKYKSRMLQYEQEAKQWHAKYTDLEKDFISLRYEKEELDKQVVAGKTSLRRCEADKAVLDGKLYRLQQELEASKEKEATVVPMTAFASAEAAPASIDYANIFSSDNLKIVEGIGPKVEALLKNHGITDWSALAATSSHQLRELLQGEGSSYRMINPDTWPHQAQLAHEGKWNELIHYQKTADITTGEETPSKAETLAMRILGFSTNPEDLKIIEGIGPKIEKLLKDDGINTWSDLAVATVSRLQKILDDAGDNFRLAEPATWPKQAELAALGKWGELHEYQEYLQGGKELA